MMRSSGLFILVFCSAISLNAANPQRNLDDVVKNIKEVAPVTVDWMFEKVSQYPHIPGIFIASTLRMGTQGIRQKPASFIIWALFGTVVAGEACKITADNYLQLKNGKHEGFGSTLIESIKKTGEDVEKVKENLKALIAPSAQNDAQNSGDEAKK